MPAYATSGTGDISRNPVIPAVLYPGDHIYLFGTTGSPPTPGQIQAPNDDNAVFEAVTVGERSISVSLSPRPGGGAPAGLSVLLIANGNPGAMEVDVQNSPMDADGTFITPTGSPAYAISTWTGPQGPNGYYVAWAELQPEGDNFVSLKVITNPNGVKLLGKLVYV